MTASLVLPALLALLLLVLVSLLAFADCSVLWLVTADGVDFDSDFDCDCDCDCVPAADPEAMLGLVPPALRTVTLLFSSRITGDEFSIALISVELAT